MLKIVLCWALAALGLLGGYSTVSAAEPIRVMSFNVRYGTAKDGENHWDKRKEFLVETIRAFDPDLLGTQETLGFQRDYLAGKLPGYGVFGVGRNDGQEDGEMMAMYYRTDRFEKLDGGHFWLSETPDVAGSKSWDSSLPRMASWLKLKEKAGERPRTLYFFNTHFDHMGKVARTESGQLLARRIDEARGGLPAILTGDFNSSEDSEAYKHVFAGGERSLVDLFRLAHPERTDQEGTANGFNPDHRKGARIDWVGATRPVKVRSAEINRITKDGRVPSDHYPIEVVLELGE